MTCYKIKKTATAEQCSKNAGEKKKLDFLRLPRNHNQTRPRPKKFAEGGVCTRERADDVPVSYPSLRSRRIAGTVKGVTKILS